MLEERHLDPDQCGGAIIANASDCDTANMYEFEIGKSDADALKSITK